MYVCFSQEAKGSPFCSFSFLQARVEGPTETLQSFVAKITEKIPGKTLSLAVTELEKHFRLKFIFIAIYYIALCNVAIYIYNCYIERDIG